MLISGLEKATLKLGSCLNERLPKQNSLSVLDSIECPLLLRTSLLSQSDFRISFLAFYTKHSYVFSFSGFLQNHPSLCTLRTHDPDLALNLFHLCLFS